MGVFQIGDTTTGTRNYDFYDGIDYFITPQYAIDKLLEQENFEGTILEPCSGNGRISKTLEQLGYTVYSSDIREDEDVYGEKGINCMSLKGIQANNLITNPPYLNTKKLLSMTQHFLTLADKKVALLLRLAFLESQARHEFLTTSPLEKVYVFSKRLTMHREGMDEKDKARGKIAFAWFVWNHDKPSNTKPIIDWLF